MRGRSRLCIKTRGARVCKAREEAREKNKRDDALVNMPVPFIEARETSFLNSLKVAIGCRDGGRE